MENAVQLYHKDKAEFDTTAFVMCQTKDLKKQMLEEKEEEGMGVATIHYGETDAFIQHIKTELWLSYQTSEVTKKGLGKVEEKKAVALKDGHMDDCFTFFMALEEESKSARVIRKCSSVLNRFLKGIEALQREGNQASDWTRVDLREVLKLMEDLIDYFAQPEGEDFETRQNCLRALRSRQDLFQEEGVLNMILDTIDKFSQMEALPDFAGLLAEDTQLMWEEISTYLYLLVAAMIKGNHYNCAQFASAQRLQWLFGRLSNPQSAEDFETRQNCLRALRSRQDLFQEEGVLNMILDTIDKFSQMEALPDFAGLLTEDTQLMWEEISTYLYLLVAAMIKGNHYNCAQFASAQRLQWLFGRLSNPQSAEGILDVLYCVLTESPEALNMINEGHIKSVISLLEKVGRDPKLGKDLVSAKQQNNPKVAGT
ncbi:unnamed protein product [Gongylonema pulchrum]|uniref:Fes1 domain-containing protein n=1 Tax=Gongylonema pulchrum TaxID=637853 RepID=A0A183E906_9BILA|nr:unnamed protein product [Gongylonema pulchrum]